MSPAIQAAASPQAPALDAADLPTPAARDHMLRFVHHQLDANQDQRLTPALIVGVLELARHAMPVRPPAPTLQEPAAS